MYERFTDRARKIIQLANQEAMRFNHDFVAPLHILISVLKEGKGLAVTALRNISKDLTLRVVRERTERIHPPPPSNPEEIIFGKLPYTPEATGIIQMAIGLSSGFNDSHVGDEHLAMAMVRSPGPVRDLLDETGLTAVEFESEVFRLRKQFVPTGSLKIEPVGEQKPFSAIVGKDDARNAILGAVARGWCHDKNTHKEMDADLVYAIADEVLKVMTPPMVITFPEPADISKEEADRVREIIGRHGSTTITIPHRMQELTPAVAAEVLRSLSDEEMASLGLRRWGAEEVDTDKLRLYLDIKRLSPKRDDLLIFRRSHMSALLRDSSDKLMDLLASIELPCPCLVLGENESVDLPNDEQLASIGLYRHPEACAAPTVGCGFTPAIALNVMEDAMKQDGDADVGGSYAGSWHDMLACVVMDAGVDREKANTIAGRFMQMAFHVTTWPRRGSKFGTDDTADSAPDAPVEVPAK